MVRIKALGSMGTKTSLPGLSWSLWFLTSQSSPCQNIYLQRRSPGTLPNPFCPYLVCSSSCFPATPPALPHPSPQLCMDTQGSTRISCSFGRPPCCDVLGILWRTGLGQHSLKSIPFPVILINVFQAAPAWAKPATLLSPADFIQLTLTGGMGRKGSHGPWALCNFLKGSLASQGSPV